MRGSDRFCGSRLGSKAVFWVKELDAVAGIQFFSDKQTCICNFSVLVDPAMMACGSTK